MLRLSCAQDLSVREVADRLKISKTTVPTYLYRAREAGIAVWPLFDKLSRVQLLILDDWGTHGMDDRQRLDLLEICEERYRRKSTMIAAQLPVAKWHDLVGEPTIADAILDRIIHNAHRINLKGESMRKKKGLGKSSLAESPTLTQTEAGG